jgi:ABC-type antimicrobial peptide transport system permease subunit
MTKFTSTISVLARRRKRKETLVFFLYVSPALLVFFLFKYWPILFSAITTLGISIGQIIIAILAAFPSYHDSQLYPYE